MIDALYISESGLNAQETLINVISNNIANSNTLGFKKNRVDFIDLVYKSNDTNSIADSKDKNNLVGMGTGIGSTSKVFTPGEMKATNNPLDIAILGEGFLEVELEGNELAYTRAGRLMVDNDGFLRTANGHKLTSNIIVPSDVTNVLISPEGQVTGYVNLAEEPIQLGQIDVAKFSSVSNLTEIGTSLYKESNDSGAPIYGKPSDSGFGKIIQGHTEISNVSMIEEMVNLTLAQRGYQLNARILQVSDQMLETINNLRR